MLALPSCASKASTIHRASLPSLFNVILCLQNLSLVGRIEAWQYFILKLASVPAPGGSRPAPKSDYIEREGRYEKDREELEHKEHGNMQGV